MNIRVSSKARDVLISLCLYTFAATLLLTNIGDHPAWPYNWEGYTAWGLFRFWDHPSGQILRPIQGLMTDSSHAAPVILLGWLGFALGGLGLAAMRVPVALIAAGAVPLLWLVGRRMFGGQVGLLGAILLALSPVYLLYARTATIVGLSLVPALLTVYALLRVLQGPGDWRWLVGLQALLLLGVYFYAPMRFLWPLSLLLLVVEWIWSRRTRLSRRSGHLSIALLVTLLTLPLALTIIQYRPTLDPITILSNYYAGRGEQVGALATRPEEYAYYIELTPEEKAQGGKPQGDPLSLAWRLVMQNTRDFGRLLLDWGTRPTLSDYWNPQGRLYPLFLAPFFLLGLGYAGWRARKRACLEYRVLIVMFMGFGLPMLLTSRIHVGRLIFMLPMLMLLVALGYVLVVRWLVGRVDSLLFRRGSEDARVGVWARFAPPILFLWLIAGVGWLTWLDYRNAPPPGREAATVAALRADVDRAKRRGGVAFVVRKEAAAVLEEINVVPYRLDLDREYRFVGLPEGLPPPPPQGDTRPPIYLGGILARLDKPLTVPNYCNNLYYVDASVESQFLDAMKGRGEICEGELEYRLLP